jgi:predicted O-methyltransferase YrrM
MQTAPEIVSRIDLAGRRDLLDLGGGSGAYAIQFCKANPDLRATVYDLPTTRPFALKTIEDFELSDRVGFAAGDFLKDSIPGAYDVVWLSQILHGEGPADCEKIVEKAVSVLRPGGMILIHEFILDDARTGPLHSALFSLNMLLATEQGRAYSDRQIRDMLARCGIRGIQRMDLKGPSGVVYGFAD